MPSRRPSKGAKIMEVESQLMRSKRGSSLSSLSVMYLERLVFSKTVPRCSSYSTSAVGGDVDFTMAEDWHIGTLDGSADE